MNRFIPIHRIIILLSFVTTLGFYYAQFLWGGTDYVNKDTLILGSIWAVLVILMLFDAERNKNHYLLIFATGILIFYLIRIISINYTDFSNCLSRSDCSSKDVNECLLFSVLCTLAMWAGLHFNLHGKTNKLVNIDVPAASKKMMKLLLFSFCLQFAATSIIPFFDTIAKMALVFFNILGVLMFSTVFYIKYWELIPKKHKIYFVLLCLLFILSFTLAGSRSAILTVAKVVIFALLAIGYFKVKIKYIIITLIVLPIMVLNFILATSLRQTASRDVSLKEKAEVFKVALDNTVDIPYRVVLAPVFDRIGSLDSATELYKQRNDFRKFINVQIELQSMVDNIFTPGFDIYDTPKVSNTIVNYYDFGITDPKLSRDLPYHSDLLTIFGESVVLFGLIGGPLFALICGFLFKFAWLYHSADDVRQIMFRSMLLMLFEKLFNSFGIDWLIFDLVTFLLVYFIVRIIIGNSVVYISIR